MDWDAGAKCPDRAAASSGSDLNGDGVVNVTDLLLVLASFDRNADGDTNGDGVTNVSDLLQILADFSQ